MLLEKYRKKQRAIGLGLTIKGLNTPLESTNENNSNFNRRWSSRGLDPFINVVFYLAGNMILFTLVYQWLIAVIKWSSCIWQDVSIINFKNMSGFMIGLALTPRGKNLWQKCQRIKRLGVRLIHVFACLFFWYKSALLQTSWYIKYVQAVEYSIELILKNTLNMWLQRHTWLQRIARLKKDKY